VRGQIIAVLLGTLRSFVQASERARRHDSAGLYHPIPAESHPRVDEMPNGKLKQSQIATQKVGFAFVHILQAERTQLVKLTSFSIGFASFESNVLCDNLI